MGWQLSGLDWWPRPQMVGGCMTRINTKTYCDLSGCDHFIVGPTRGACIQSPYHRGNGWTIWNGKDLCPEHEVHPESWPEDSIILYDSPNYMRNVDSNQMVFRTVRWCTTHDDRIPDRDRYIRFDGADQNHCYAAILMVTDGCEFVDKLVQL
jgi:hypothetical protein